MFICGHLCFPKWGREYHRCRSSKRIDGHFAQTSSNTKGSFQLRKSSQNKLYLLLQPINSQPLQQIHNMKTITNKLPLSQLLENSHLVTSLPFVDGQVTNGIVKTKIEYLVRSQMEAMGKQPDSYLGDLVLPRCEGVYSGWFEAEVQRVQKKAQLGEKKGRKEVEVYEPPKKIAVKQKSQATIALEKTLTAHQHYLTKTANLELYHQFGPPLFKELLSSLESKKQTLQTEITKKTQTIYEINQLRKYEQLQSFQREDDMNERCKIMLNKKVKLE